MLTDLKYRTTRTPFNVYNVHVDTKYPASMLHVCFQMDTNKVHLHIKRKCNGGVFIIAKTEVRDFTIGQPPYLNSCDATSMFMNALSTLKLTLNNVASGRKKYLTVASINTFHYQIGNEIEGLVID